MRKQFKHIFSEPLLSKCIDDAIEAITGIKKNEKLEQFAIKCLNKFYPDSAFAFIKFHKHGIEIFYNHPNHNSKLYNKISEGVPNAFVGNVKKTIDFWNSCGDGISSTDWRIHKKINENSLEKSIIFSL